MKLYAPEYYKKFKCIADKCEHSCCVGWEIDIDSETLAKYRDLKDGYGAVVADSISMDGTPHFKLCGQDRCPHLDERGLCKIITNLGADHLCDICREHPRFYTYTDVAEVGIGMSCPEAARLVLSSPHYADMVEIDSVDAAEDEIGFNGRAERDGIYSILQDRICDYSCRIKKIQNAYAIDAGEDCRWLEILDSLEYLDEAHKKLFMNYSSDRRPPFADEYRERFLAYLVYRHCTEAVDSDDFRSRLGFCLFCERLFSSLICSEGAKAPDRIAQLASIISEEIEYSEDNTLALMY